MIPVYIHRNKHNAWWRVGKRRREEGREKGRKEGLQWSLHKRGKKLSCVWDLNQLGGTERLLLLSGESVQGESQRKESRVVWKPHQDHNLPWMEGFRLSKGVKSTRSQDVLQNWQVLSHQSWDRYELSTYYDAGFPLSRKRETSTGPASTELWAPQAKPVLRDKKESIKVLTQGVM